jgi:hypothetical protein
MIAMARTLFVLNHAPCGTERSYAALRRAGAFSEREGCEGNSRPDVGMFQCSP